MHVSGLENSLNISASEDMPVLAGTALSLRCIAVNDRIQSLCWLDARGNIITSGDGVNVSLSQLDGVTGILTLTFESVRTSQAGNYSCKCEDNNSTYLVDVQSKFKNVNLFAILKISVFFFSPRAHCDDTPTA